MERKVCILYLLDLHSLPFPDNGALTLSWLVPVPKYLRHTNTQTPTNHPEWSQNCWIAVHRPPCTALQNTAPCKLETIKG